MRRRPTPPDETPAGEAGMVSLLSLLAVLGLLVMFGLLANVGRVSSQKLEVQNGADAVAYSAGNEMARSLNTVSAVNHLIGELSAFVVLHHGFGGEPLADRERVPPVPTDVKMAVEISYQLAKIMSQLGELPIEPLKAAYDEAKEAPEVGGAIWDSRVRLMKVLTWAFGVHAYAGFLTIIPSKIPVIGDIIVGIVTVAIVLPVMAFEGKVWEEYQVLNLVETLAKAAKPVRRTVEEVVIPGLSAYAQGVALATPLRMEDTAEAVGEQNLVSGKLYPGVRNFSLPMLSVPVKLEPAKPRELHKSQLMRAATPWVQYWRVPWLKFGEDALLLARFKPHYWDRTDEYAETLMNRFRDERRVRLYTLEGYDLDADEKGNEPWQFADGSREADRRFAVVGFGHRGRPGVASPSVFRQTNPDGIAAYAQAFVYNANPNPRTKRGGFQPNVAYDTLAWVNDLRDHPGERPADDETYSPVPSVPEPQARLNWQVKLVPVTRVTDAIMWQRDDLGKVMRRTTPDHLNLSGTH